MVPAGIGAVEARSRRTPSARSELEARTAANRGGSPAVRASTTWEAGPGAMWTSEAPAVARAAANIRKMTVAAGAARVGKELAGGAGADAVEGTSAGLTRLACGLVGGEVGSLIAQPPIADIGRSGWMNAGSSMP